MPLCVIDKSVIVCFNNIVLIYYPLRLTEYVEHHNGTKGIIFKPTVWAYLLKNNRVSAPFYVF